ncbi:hypothetical protein HPB48_005087 [Haemaphysalis longicornis]|uniref:Uncharacterized protein n=1 Tax=Haemaphysalis longicornis TaxID=44386 RepID=A0A9J6FH36_HAELO|nr:hypothetical protein HPB48_005087 [Haemaphysalis longicornis]
MPLAGLPSCGLSVSLGRKGFSEPRLLGSLGDLVTPQSGQARRVRLCSFPVWSVARVETGAARRKKSAADEICAAPLRPTSGDAPLLPVGRPQRRRSVLFVA